MKNNYVVKIGDIRDIPCSKKREANQAYNEFVSQSKKGIGDSAGQDISMLNNREIEKEYYANSNIQHLVIK